MPTRLREMMDRRGNDERSVLLIHPPYGDFTYPYHSLSYVTTPLKAAGFAVDVLDLNILWFRRLFVSCQIDGWRAEFLDEFHTLDRRGNLDLQGQKRIVDLLQCVAICNSLSPERAVETFRSNAFYDFDKYLWARSQVRAFEKLLTHVYHGYDFFTSFAIPPYIDGAKGLVDRAGSLSRLTNEFTQILSQYCQHERYLFCGVSFPFSSHLIPGMAVFPALAKLFPGTPLVAGGTAVSDVFKYKRDMESLQPFQELADFFYLGEAETGIVDFAKWCGGEVDDLPKQAVNLHTLEAPPLSGFPYVSLSPQSNKEFHSYPWTEQPPDYDWIDWNLYLAPERRVNYSPARGCFWNRCTFCDYGLNTDAPTAPSRSAEVEIVVRDLKRLAQQSITHVYLAVDAIAPSFLNAFADCLLKEKLNIHWSTQFFLTRQFTEQFVHKLEASGLRVASFGLESGSSRVLEWMGKGADRVEGVLRPALASFAASRIGLQPLFFFGFPGETDDDRQETVRMLLNNKEVFSTISKGGLFDLLPGSIIAKDPDRFGISQIQRRPSDDIAGTLRYKLGSDAEPPSCTAFRGFNEMLPHWSAFERPWAGGVDTFHTQLYIEKFGRDIFHRLRASYAQEEEEPWGSVAINTHLNLDEILDNAVLHNAVQSLNAGLPLGEHSSTTPEAQIPLEYFQPVLSEQSEQHFELRLRQYREL